MGVIELVDSFSVCLFLLSLCFLYSVLDSIKSFVIEFFVRKVHLKVNMSARFQAKAYGTSSPTTMYIHENFSPLKAKKNKERKRERKKNQLELASLVI